MSIINVTSKTFNAAPHRNSARSYIKYLKDSEPHNTNDFINERNERVSSNCGDIAVAVSSQYRHMNFKKNSVQAYSIVQSFSTDELDYRNPADIDLAHKIGTETANRLNQKYKKMYGGSRKWAVFTQADNTNHRLHNHIALLNYDNHGRALPNGVKWKKDLLPINEEVTGKYLTKDKQRHIREKTYQTAEAIANADTTQNGERRRGIKAQKESYVETAFYQALRTATTEKQLTDELAAKGIVTQERYRGKVPLEFDENGRDYTWYTKKNNPRKNLSFTYNGLIIRTNKFNRKISTVEILDQIRLNRQRQQQRRVRIEKQVEQQPTTPPIKKPVVNKKPVAKPQKARQTKAPEPLQQAITKPQKKQVAPKKQPDKPIKPKEHHDQQQAINLLRQQLQFIRQRLLNEKKKEKVATFSNTENRLEKMIANMTSQQSVAETERARAKQKEEETVPE